MPCHFCAKAAGVIVGWVVTLPYPETGGSCAPDRDALADSVRIEQLTDVVGVAGDDDRRRTSQGLDGNQGIHNVMELRRLHQDRSVACAIEIYRCDLIRDAEDGPYILEAGAAGDRLGHDDHRHDQCGVRVANFVLEHGPHGRITASELRDSVGIQDNGSS